MAYNRTQARRLLSPAEFELFEQSLDADPAMTAARLQSKAQRARRLRDKYRDLYRRQRVSMRNATGSKGGRSGEANARTEAKARVFEEVLARLSRELAQREAAARRAVAQAAKKTAPRSKKAARPAAKRSPKAPAPAAPKSLLPAAPAARAKLPAAAQRGNPLLNPRNKSISAHVRAQGRRAQARRDRR